jgi:hypothetical protein
VSAVIADSDLGRLCALARQWQGNPFGFGRARDLAAVLNGIIARRAPGGDVLEAIVDGDTVPELHAAALSKAAELWGTSAQAVVEATGTVHANSVRGEGKFYANVTVRCLNYAEIADRGTVPDATTPPGGAR